jgi:GTP-binding protein HflX
VLNKLDLTGLPPAVERDEYGRIQRVRVSARSGEGLSLLREALAESALEKVRNLRSPVKSTSKGESFPIPDTVLDSGSPYDR